MLVRKSLCSFVLALLVTQAVASNYRRQDGPSGGGPQRPTASTPSVTPTSDDPESTPSVSSVSSTSSSIQTTPTPVENDPETTPDRPPPTTDEAQQTPNTSLNNIPSLTQSVNDEGETVTVTNTNTRVASSSGTSRPVQTSPSPQTTDPPIGTGAIVGMSVAGGLAVIGIIAFFVWKFTRKNSSTFDDNEPIKWPDLNSHNVDSHALPVNNTGRAGFDSQVSLTRDNSSNYSTPDFHAGGNDPYAVPPLPHLNPNQPYRDDPTGASGYYDPYRGPIQDNASSDWNHGDAIPMNQIHGQGAAGYDVGRQSPGPQMAYGRQSPGPMQAYDTNGAGYPQQFDAGRQSPGPAAAYGARTASPGPNVMYNAAYNPASQAYGPR